MSQREANDEVDCPGNSTLRHGDLRGAEGVETCRDGVVNSPAKTGRHHQDRAGRDSGLGGSGEDHSAEYDDHDAAARSLADVFLKEEASDQSSRDQCEVEEQRHRASWSPVDRKHEEHRCKSSPEAHGEKQSCSLPSCSRRALFADRKRQRSDRGPEVEKARQSHGSDPVHEHFDGRRRRSEEHGSGGAPHPSVSLRCAAYRCIHPIKLMSPTANDEARTASSTRAVTRPVCRSLFWLVAAIVAGPPIGVAGSWSRKSGWRCGIGLAVLGGVLLGEGVYGWSTVSDTTVWRYWALEATVGAFVIVGAAVRTRRPVDATLSLVAGSATAAVLLAGRLA